MFKVKFDAWSFLVVLLYVIMLEVFLLMTTAQSVACPVAHPGLHLGGRGERLHSGRVIWNTSKEEGGSGGSLLENC